MFRSLKNIRNPIARATTAGLTASAITTMLSAVIIGLTAPKSESAHKIAVYTSAIFAASGAVFGLIIATKKDESVKKTSAQFTLSQAESDQWKDWRNFVVIRKVRESQEITSFYLKPQDQEKIYNYKPGQFLTIKLNIPGIERSLIRTYSLSDYTPNCEYYRLSIKREDAPPRLNVPPGIVSNFMHDHVKEGTVIQAKPPNGKFFLDVSQETPAILISNGVGITPMIAMAKASTLHNRNRQIWFLHGARSGDYHAFREEVLGIAQQNPNFHVHYRYSRPNPGDEGYYHSQGYVDIDLIKMLIAPELEKVYGSVANKFPTPTNAEYFLCGSPPFMESIREGLKAWGVPESQVFFESFSKSKEKAESSNPTSTVNSIETAEIVFSQSKKTLTWTSDDGTILEFAEANEINPPYSCRAGICLTCMCRVESGEVEYLEPPTGTPDEGSALICISKPKTKRLVLEL